MGWAQEVHASRLQSTPRKKIQSQHHLPTPKPRKANAGIFPIVLVAGAVSTALWWRKGPRKFSSGRDPLASLGGFVKRLLGGSGRRASKSNNEQWKASRPASMAAAAAAQRAQAGNNGLNTAAQGETSQSRNKKKKNKKKRKH